MWFAGAKEIVYYNGCVDCFIQPKQNSCSILNRRCSFQFVEEGAALLARRPNNREDTQVVGQHLREIREKLNLTLRDVEAQSRRIAEGRQNTEYLFTAGRLSQVENSNSLPSLYKLASLCEIYQIPYPELLRFYGIETSDWPQGNGGGGSPVGEGEENPGPHAQWASSAPVRGVA